MTHGSDPGLMKAWTTGLLCRVVRDVSQHLQMRQFEIHSYDGRLTKIRFVRNTYRIISGTSPNNLFAASLLYGMAGMGFGRIAL
jgi:hypothetical protein